MASMARPFTGSDASPSIVTLLVSGFFAAGLAASGVAPPPLPPPHPATSTTAAHVSDAVLNEPWRRLAVMSREVMVWMIRSEIGIALDESGLVRRLRVTGMLDARVDQEPERPAGRRFATGVDVVEPAPQQPGEFLGF